MQIFTKAIVLSAIKYGDSSLIVTCFTHQEGIKSYMLQGVLSKKKGKITKSQFFPLSLLQIHASHNLKGNLHRITEAKVLHPLTTIHTDFVKQSLVYFLSEFLSSVLREEGENTFLFDFLETAILWLDCHDEVANFHLKFLIELTKYLGFYPDETNKEKEYYFHLMEGRYVSNQGMYILHGEALILWNRVLGIKFEDLNKKPFHKHQRVTILELVLKYYQLHMATFKKPKSLEVLSKVLE